MRLPSLYVFAGAASLVRNAFSPKTSSSTHYWVVTSSTNPEKSTLVLLKMHLISGFRTNVIALNVSSSNGL